jgi:hypothetical protein
VRSVALWTLAALGTSLACGSRAHAGVQAPETGRIHAEIRDTSVDALPHVRIPVSPDLVLAAVDVGTADVAFRFRFRPDSFDPATTRVVVDLDIDQNAETGLAGVEYQLRVFPASGRGAEIVKTAGTTETMVGTVSVSAVEDGCDLTIPRRLLGDDDGRFDLRVRIYADQAPATVLDVLPDIGFVRVQ